MSEAPSHLAELLRVVDQLEPRRCRVVSHMVFKAALKAGSEYKMRQRGSRASAVYCLGSQRVGDAIGVSVQVLGV